MNDVCVWIITETAIISTRLASWTFTQCTVSVHNSIVIYNIFNYNNNCELNRYKLISNQYVSSMCVHVVIHIVR